MNQDTGQRKPTARQTKRRRVILDTALQLVAELGYDGVSMRALADRADVALRTLYNLYESKELLLIAAVEYANRASMDRIMRSNPFHGFKGLIAIIDAVTDHMLRNQVLTRAVTPLIVKDSGLFAVRQIYGEVHRKYILQIKSSGDLSKLADVNFITRILMIQQNSALLSWATGEVETEMLRPMFHLFAAFTLLPFTLNDTASHAERLLKTSVSALKSMGAGSYFSHPAGSSPLEYWP